MQQQSGARALVLVSAAALMLAARRPAVGAIEAADGGAAPWDFDAPLMDLQGAFMALVDTAPAPDADAAQANVGAFLATLRRAEGTERAPDAYRVTYGYGVRISDLSDHPAITGEWPGVVLSDTMCANAGFGPGCRSTAAGAYQIIKPTWVKLRQRLGLPDFGPASQDAAAVELIRQRGALGPVMRGEFRRAVELCRQEWASLPGNKARQGQRSIETLASWYSQAGGTYA